MLNTGINTAIRIGASLGVLLVLCMMHADRIQAQTPLAPNSPLKAWTSGQWTFITDQPIDKEIQSWPKVLDQALVQWCQKWNISIADAKQWPLTIHWMGDRKLFEQAGLLDGTPPFDDGFQLADKIFFVEQPSEYYRRHLLLHEATHWVMYRAFGGGGSPWFMEGMAETEATHRLSNGILQLAVIPSDPTEVPHWGRFKRLRSAVDASEVPSLKQILHYGNERENRMDRYVWSWAACVFFRNHPKYSDAFRQAASDPLDYSLKLSNKLESILKEQWHFVEADWWLFAQDFDFGFDPSKYLVSTESLLSLAYPANRLEVQTNLNWQTNLNGQNNVNGQNNLNEQSSAGGVKKGIPVSIEASGDFIVASPLAQQSAQQLAQQSAQQPATQFPNDQAWHSSANGITIRYHRHFPLGKLLGCFIPKPSANSPASTQSQPASTVPTPAIFPVGKKTLFTPPSDGWLLFKINEPTKDLFDNSGTLEISVRPVSNQQR